MCPFYLKLVRFTYRTPHDCCESAGSLSGAIISTCLQPLDVVRTRMQADASRNAVSGMMNTFNTIVKENGVR